MFRLHSISQEFMPLSLWTVTCLKFAWQTVKTRKKLFVEKHEGYCAIRMYWSCATNKAVFQGTKCEQPNKVNRPAVSNRFRTPFPGQSLRARFTTASYHINYLRYFAVYLIICTGYRQIKMRGRIWRKNDTDIVTHKNLTKHQEFLTKPTTESVGILPTQVSQII